MATDYDALYAEVEALRQERDRLKQIQAIDLDNNNQYREQVAQLQAYIAKLQQERDTLLNKVYVYETVYGGDLKPWL